MASTFIGIGIGIIIATLAVGPGNVTQYGRNVLSMFALAGVLIVIVLLAV